MGEYKSNSNQRGREKRMMKKVVEALEESEETGSRRSRKKVKYIEDESESSEEKHVNKNSKKNDSDFVEDENEEFISAETTESESPPRKRIKTDTDSRRSG